MLALVLIAGQQDADVLDPGPGHGTQIEMSSLTPLRQPRLRDDKLEVQRLLSGLSRATFTRQL